ncbi:MAG: substrate-binding domain-containing protein [Planctomycetes bacterium]|nr:substrate-binding domain-containing protein [Planctomycetota bacterium]
MDNNILKSKPHKYQLIRPELEKLIDGMEPGDKLPSERDLAKHFSCTTITLRRALAILEEQGLIDRRHGSGTFVTDRSQAAGDNKLKRNLNRLGMIISSNSDSYAHQVIKALAQVAAAANVELRSTWASDFGDEAMQRSAELEREGCSALILPWFPENEIHNVQQFILNARLPVSIPVLIPGFEKNCFEISSVFGISLNTIISGLCQYFSMLGCKQVAYIGPDAPNDNILQKMLGSFTSYCCRTGIDTICGLVGSKPSDMDGLAEKWSKLKNKLAIICYDDSHALRFSTAMHKRGLSAPDDFFIIGLNNTDESLLCDPPLTTVDHDFTYDGTWLMRNAMAMAKGEIDQSKNQASHVLIVRDSCGGKDKVDKQMVDKLKLLGLDISCDKSDVKTKRA